MRIWENKLSNKKVCVTEWWESPESESLVDQPFVEVEMPDGKNRKVRTKMGILYQVGWLLKNEHGVWFGVNLDTEGQFNDLGPFTPKDG